MYQAQENYQHHSFAKSARINFVKKVYSILSVQLLFTVFTVYLNFSSKSFARFQAQNTWAFWLTFIGSIISLISLFYGKISRSFPSNVIAVGVFTFCESYLVSYVCSIYQAQSVLLSAVATLAATLGLTFHAFTTKEDYTSMGCYIKGFISSFVWIALSLSLINLFFVRSQAIVTILAGIFAVIYSVYILIDTQLIMGGKNREISLDDYVMGATILYVDIIGLFLKLLQLLGKKKND